MLVESDAHETVVGVCKKWHGLGNHISIWKQVEFKLEDGMINWRNFQKLRHRDKKLEDQFGQISKGTEGTCFKCKCRSRGTTLAVKRARVFPKGEGVAYYMLRELAVLQDMRHPHINQLYQANLAQDKLHIFFPYVHRTLQDVLVETNPNGANGELPGTPNTAANTNGTPLSAYQVKRLLHQLLDATAYCHRRGVYHRNLKPKHLLIELPEDGDLDKSVLKVADFALVRSSGLPRRTYTAKVVTLWYRAPEILMGVTKYSHAVDTWSVGCVFAEMVLGRPLFTGSSEIDQLFQLFSTMGTPTEETWPGFTGLPNYGFAFPNWPGKPLKRIVKSLCEQGRDLLQRLLKYNPDDRISAEQALQHPYFGGAIGSPQRSLTPAIVIRPDGDMPHGPDVFYLHQYLREAEKECWPMAQYLTGEESTQPDMLPVHRSMLVDWLVELVDVFDMYLRSAFLAVAYTDKFLSKEGVEREKLQLVAATCLHVASKCEDTAYISVNDLVMCADNLYTSQEVLAMEENLLNSLGFRLSVPNVYDFLKIFQEMMPGQEALEPTARWLAEYLSELSLQEYKFLKYLPSMVASCAISLALYCTGKPHWPKNLQAASLYEWAQLEECMKQMQEVYTRSPMTVLAVIRTRYQKEQRERVATLSPPTQYGGMEW
jgi:serine/threonine protein kinase